MIYSKRTIRTVLAVAPLLVLSAVVCLQWRYDAIVAERFILRAPVHRSVMPASVLRHLTFGFNNILADYYWVSAVQAYLKWDSHDAYYPEYFRIINALDPEFEYPYSFAILTIPNKRNSASLDWLAEIASDGMNAFPDSYQIPFSAAMQYHIVGKDNARAVHFLSIAATRPTATELVHRTYAIYLMKEASDYKKSRALFETLLQSDENDETKKMIAERIELLDFIEGLEQSIQKHRSVYGTYPESVPDLVKKSGLRLTKEANALVQKYSPQIDQETGKILLR